MGGQTWSLMPSWCHLDVFSFHLDYQCEYKITLFPLQDLLEGGIAISFQANL